MKWQTWFLVAAGVCFFSVTAGAGDWPQWRGANRDGKATDFSAPKTWPKELTQKWKVAVGDGVATPSLVGDKLFVFSRQGGNEAIRCLDAASGKELWQDKYESQGASGPARSFAGPRCSPTVVDGKVITLGANGMLSCLEATTGKLLWRKDDFKGAVPNFFTSSSPIVVDGLCIAQLGGNNNGAIVAYDLAAGGEKWKWTGDSPAYASPTLMTVAGTKLIVAMTERRVVAVGAADGKLVWETPFAATRGPAGGYNAATPIVDGQTIIFTGSGRGAKAIQIEKGAGGFVAKELWTNPEKSVMFNTPVLKEGKLYGLTQNNELYCINAENGTTAWSGPAVPAAPAGGGGGRMGRGGYGSIVDAGSVLLALTPASELIVFQPSDKAYTENARIKVAATATYAYPVVAGNRVFVKDQDSVTLLTIE